MVCHESTGALVPGMSAFHDPALGLHDEALGDDRGPHEIERLPRVLPRTGAALAGVGTTSTLMRWACSMLHGAVPEIGLRTKGIGWLAKVSLDASPVGLVQRARPAGALTFSQARKPRLFQPKNRS